MTAAAKVSTQPDFVTGQDSDPGLGFHDDDLLDDQIGLASSDLDVSPVDRKNNLDLYVQSFQFEDQGESVPIDVLEVARAEGIVDPERGGDDPGSEVLEREDVLCFRVQEMSN